MIQACSRCPETNETAAYIKSLIAQGKLWKFYKGKAWITLKQQVLEENHFECRICKQNGIITRYDESPDGKRRLLSTVHHVNEVREHPDLALSRFYFDSSGERHDNLIPVCKACHNALHNRTFQGSKYQAEHFTNAERW